MELGIASIASWTCMTSVSKTEGQHHQLTAIWRYVQVKIKEGQFEYVAEGRLKKFSGSAQAQEMRDFQYTSVNPEEEDAIIQSEAERTADVIAQQLAKHPGVWREPQR
jgi:hypothetical protein